jgi:hypothetical protein
MMRTCRDTARYMKIGPTKLLLLAAASVLPAICVTPASSQGYSYEEQEACGGDALRLCSEFIPDIPRISTCMLAKHDQLSQRCARILDAKHERHLDDPSQRPSGAPDQPY